MTSKPVIGVLALQGCVTPHKPHIEAAGGVFRPVKRAADFDGIDGLILPGGESTTMLKLIDRFELADCLKKAFERMPVWGICAGAILMGESVANPIQRSYGVIPVTLIRNGYGRQMDSTHFDIEGYTVSFIRAPIMAPVNDDVEILAKRGESPVWVLYNDKMATSFHPELTQDYPSPMHERFMSLITKH